MPKKLKRLWRKFEYKHTTALVVTVVIFILLLDSAIMTAFFEFVRELEYVGMLLAGVFFVSVFTAPAGVVMLFELGQVYSPLQVTVLAGVGTVIGDYLILRLFETQISKELIILLKRARLHKVLRLLRRKTLKPIFLLIGLGIVGSPLPDEVGITLLDMSRQSKAKILILCFFANLIGVAAIVAAGYAAKGNI